MTITAPEAETSIINHRGLAITLVGQDVEAVRRYLLLQTSESSPELPALLNRTTHSIHTGTPTLESVRSEDLPQGEGLIFIGVRVQELSEGGSGTTFVVHPRPYLFKRLPAEHELRDDHFQALDASSGEPIEGSSPDKFLLLSPTLDEGRMYAGIRYGGIIQYAGKRDANTDDPVLNFNVVTSETNTVSDSIIYREAQLSGYFRVPVGDMYLPRIVEVGEIERTSWESLSEYERFISIESRLKGILGLRSVEKIDITTQQMYIVGNHTPGDNKWQVGRFDTDQDFFARRDITYVHPTTGHIAVGIEVGGYRRTDDHDSMIVLKAPDNWDSIISGTAPLPSPGRGLFTLEAARNVLVGFRRRFDEMDEALNEYAESAAHCSEFEDSVIPLGFSGRDSYNTVEWDVDVEVDFTYSESDLGSSDTMSIERVLGLDNILTGGELTFNGTASIRLQIDGPRDADADHFSYQISTDDILEQLPGDFEISDWRVEDWNDNN